MLRSVFLSLVIFVVALSSMVAPSTCIVFALSAPGCTCSYLSRYSDAAPSSHMASPTIVTMTMALRIVASQWKERTATTTALSSNSIRWVMGPSGTVVIFPNEVGLPSIFEPKACSYPPPREKCASPSCMNTYKYRLQIQATFLQSPVLQGNT
ncbi:hypothetical protein CQW23_02459 [Capsicum baccatum]|uniref:Secreted protein n=1 Tax=Capsicum baccatum TaxID=33114 RepID=A0A2G2XRG7_CAPBA|nr:hypothetical protein CQW23_02459 [Capsicum baccatum]